jgi:hypothetical protein
VQELDSFSLLPLMGYNLVLNPPTLKARWTRRLTRRDELAALDRVRQWPKSQNVIRVTLLIVEAVACSIYDHSFTGAKIGGELYNQNLWMTKSVLSSGLVLSVARST